MTAPLRRLRQDDAPAVLAAFRSAPDMARQGTVTTPAEAEAYVARLCDPAGPHRAFAIDVDSALAGLVAVTVDAENRNGWFWYWMHAAHRGGGLVTTSARAVADWALGEEGGCERLELGHRVNNPASGAVARAAGFVLEGRERGKFLIAGERIDVLTYGRLRSDP
ncbi:GNAT family N-acetyltransferase [Microbacterium bovistercoris]|uniref:GNAT family N-acetyltransferase n=1 Tax=Microbacterium bovistercoris TaxID=2293570 RepID=UPI001C6EE531|nr:GNAT family protein [Microbacterium bovistercoris]